MTIKTASLCDTGGRPINDDTVRIRQDGGRLCVYVGDGLGGYAGGKLASEAAGEEHPRHHTHQQRQQERQGVMKTTLVFLTVEDGQARWMHVGDSRLYHFRSGKLQTQTMDHSVSQMAVLMGDITPQEIRFHEDRNRVLRALGGDNAKADLSPILVTVQEEDVFLLCTDGFWEYVYEPEMEDLLQKAKDPQDWLKQMETILLSRVSGENDNYTAAAVFC